MVRRPDTTRTPLLLDANVRIDFVESDRDVLPLIARTLGPIYVPLPVLVEEVPQIAVAEYEKLGLGAVEPPLDILLAAAVRRAGLSFHDHLCLLLARDRQWCCVTNDGRLRRECATEEVRVLWGLEVLALVVEARALERGRAAQIAHAIHVSNPRYITQAVVEAFIRRIGARK